MVSEVGEWEVIGLIEHVDELLLFEFFLEEAVLSGFFLFLDLIEGLVAGLLELFHFLQF